MSRPRKQRAPPWSWAATDGPIEMCNHIYFALFDPDWELSQVHTVLVEMQVLQYGPVQVSTLPDAASGYIDVKGPLKLARFLEHNESCPASSSMRDFMEAGSIKQEESVKLLTTTGPMKGGTPAHFGISP